MPNKPTLTVTSDGRIGGTLYVSGTGFTPSEGGQQVLLWIGYPDDYCNPNDLTKCHGFYAYPFVERDGTFDVQYEDALLQIGTGKVAATQYNHKNDKWVEVDSVEYRVI